MTLLETIDQISHFDDDATIFAAPIEGELRYESPTTVVSIPDDELALKTSNIATKYCPGMEYVFPVFLAKEAIEVWSLWRDRAIPNTRQATDAVIFYSKHDAYLPVDRERSAEVGD